MYRNVRSYSCKKMFVHFSGKAVLIGRTTTMYLKYYNLYIIIVRIVLVITQGQASEGLDFCFNSTLEGT
jgi:hypothetical protein